MGWVMVLASCLCFGITNCLWAVVQKKERYINVIVYRTFVTCTLFAAYLLLWSEPDNLGNTLHNWRTWATAIGISLASCCGLLCYVYSLRFTTVSIAVPLSSINALFGVLTALLFLGEHFHFSLLVAFSAVTAALWLLQHKGGSFQWSKGLLLNLGAAFFWGVTFALFVIPVRALGPWRFGLVLESTVLVTALLIAASSQTSVSFYRFKKNIGWYLLMGCLGFGGLIFYNISLRYLEVSVISIASLSTLFISLCLSKWWLKERLTLKESLSVALLLAAIFVLKWYY